MLPTGRYRQLIDAAAHHAALPKWEGSFPDIPGGVWLEGLILTESAGDPGAYRYEAHQDTLPDGDTPGKPDVFCEDDASYGLMQVMGYNARRLVGVHAGVPQDFSWLFLPMVNIALGLRILCAELAATKGDVARALARYNGGPTGERLGADGKMRRQEYVDKVLANARRVAEDRL